MATFMLSPLFALLSLLALLTSGTAAAAASSASTTTAPRDPASLTLRDRPIVNAGPDPVYLDGDWDLSSRSHSLPGGGRVPGDLISDLVAAGLLAEPLYENNFLLNASLWNEQAWTYSRTVTLTAEQVKAVEADDGGDVWLVFDGIKLGANITLNGVLLAVSRNQFLRQELSLRTLIRSTELKLQAGDNELAVLFDPDIDEYGQFMQCSGGWDWAPVSQSKTRGSNQGVYTRGIWKSVYLVDVAHLALTQMTAHVMYNGAFPTEPLQAGKHDSFNVTVTLFLSAPQPCEVDVSAGGDWLKGTIDSSRFSLDAGNSTVVQMFEVTAQQIELWWPNGRGAQPLYTVSVNITVVDGPATSTSQRVGFRVFHVVTGNDTDPTWVEEHAGDNGSGQQGLRYRVNGEPIFARGANMIPIDMLEGRYHADTYQRVILSAADAGMNLVRVWAGGVWLNDVFYDTADEAGVMIYHDQINRWFFNNRPEEIAAYQYQLRRTSSHPAIVAWNGCNECFPLAGGGIVPELMTLVTNTDPSRALWPACPAEGWASGVNRLTGLPNGEPLVKRDIPVPWGPLDTHGPYQHGDGFPAVNGDSHLNMFDTMTPSHFDASAPIGMEYNHTFTSEFGAVHWSSFESVSACLHPSHWSLHGGSAPDNCSLSGCNGTNVIAQRNYPCDSIVLSYFGGSQSLLDAVGESALKQQLFKCLVGSALIVKGYIEQHRAANTFGLMTWQLNEIWPTGGWGSLEYGNGQYPGQVVGGRWKPTHYWLLHSLYTDVMVSCGLPMDPSNDGEELLCYVKLDAWQPGTTKWSVVVEQYELADSSRPARRMEMAVALAPGPGSIEWWRLNSSWSSNTSVLQLSVLSPSASHREPVTTNFFLPAAPHQLTLTPGMLDMSATIVDGSHADEAVIVVRKGSKAAALFVTLTTLAAGRFSHNCFHMFGREINVTFMAFGKLNRTLLSSSLRWEHANAYTQQSEPQQQQVEQRVQTAEVAME